MTEPDKIKFENTHLDTMRIRKYPLGSLGNTIDWLNAYGLIQYDIVQIGENDITLHGKLIATYIIDNIEQHPVFAFEPEFDWLNDVQEHYLRMFKTEYGINFIAEYKKKYENISKLFTCKK